MGLAKMSNFAVRPHQVRALKGIRRCFNDDVQSWMNHMATGTGKTFVTHEAIMELFPPEKFRTFIVGGVNIDVNLQMESALISYSPQLAGRYGENGYAAKGVGIVMDKRDDVDARIVVGSIQTLIPNEIEDHLKLPKFTDRDVLYEDGRIYHNKITSRLPYLVSPRFDKILEHGLIDFWVHDEAHHAVSDGTFGFRMRVEALYNFLGIKLFKYMGNTATMKRTDKRGMHNITERIAFSYSIKEAQDDGWLVPFADPQRVAVDLGFGAAEEEIHEIKVASVDNWGDLVAKAWKEKCLNDDGTWRPTVMYTEKIHEYSAVEASRVLAKKLNENGIKAVHVDATTTIDIDGTELPKRERNEVYRRLAQGEIQVITNCDVVIEGVDIPPISAVFLLKRLGELKMTQVLGRGLRLFPGDQYLPAKEDLLVVDFTGQALQISTMCSLMGYTVDGEKKEIDWEPLFDEFKLLWEEQSVAIQAWIADMRHMRLELGQKYGYAVELALMRSPEFNNKHAYYLRQILGAFGEDELMDSRQFAEPGYVMGEGVVYKLAEILSDASHDWDEETGGQRGMMILPVNRDESLFITSPNNAKLGKVKEMFQSYLGGNRNIDSKQDRQMISLFTLAQELYGTYTMWHVKQKQHPHKKYYAEVSPKRRDSHLPSLLAESVNYIATNMVAEDSFLKTKRRWKQHRTGGTITPVTDSQKYVIGQLCQRTDEPYPDYDRISKGQASKQINYMIGLTPILDKFNKIEHILFTKGGKAQ
jgi:superfamily II DNA or RNA helicase